MIRASFHLAVCNFVFYAARPTDLLATRWSRMVPVFTAEFLRCDRGLAQAKGGKT